MPPGAVQRCSQFVHVRYTEENSEMWLIPTVPIHIQWIISIGYRWMVSAVNERMWPLADVPVKM